jgi:hypothetical protein
VHLDFLQACRHLVYGNYPLSPSNPCTHDSQLPHCGMRFALCQQVCTDGHRPLLFSSYVGSYATAVANASESAAV